jgi:hypothetical protein
MRVGGRSAMVCVVALFAMLLVPGTAPASSQPETFVTIVSEPGDLLADGVTRFYHPGNASFTITTSDRGITSFIAIRLETGNRQNDFDLSFGAPPGEELHPGEYERAVDHNNTANRPHMNINGVRGCSSHGRFRLNQFETTSEGTLSKLWIVFEQQCLNRTPAVIGEVRINVEGDGGDVVMGQREVRWRNTDPPDGRFVVPVVVFNPGPNQVSMAESKVIGANARAFSILDDRCGGQALAPQQVCAVFVRFKPTSPGAKNARLIVPESDGDIHRVRLEGFAYDGSTRLALRSTGQEYIGGYRSRHNYDPTSMDFDVRGDPQYVIADLRGRNGSRWRAEFQAPEGDTLASGVTYEDATRYPFNYPGAGLSFTGTPHGGSGRSCNRLNGTFSVTEILFDAQGELKRFGVNFEQQCEEGRGVLRGMIDFRTRSPQPWPTMKSSTVLPIARLGKRLVVSGVVKPGHYTGNFSDEPTGTVSVKLKEKEAGRWLLVGTKHSRLSDHGARYEVSFVRPQRRWCKLVAHYSGDDVYSASYNYRTFRCEGWHSRGDRTLEE